jgi:hypothetical protein
MFEDERAESAERVALSGGHLAGDVAGSKVG